MVRSAVVTLKAESQVQALSARIAELEAALAREERISAALRDVGVALGTTLDLDQLLELILQKITDLLDADRATLYLLDEARGELVSRIAVGDAIRSVRIKVGHGIAGVVARTGKTIRVRDAYSDRRFTKSADELPGYRTQSILAAPMKNHLGRIIGVVHVLNKKSRREFTTGDEALLNAFATEAAVSIDNSRLFLSVIQKNMQLLETKEKLEQSVRHLKLLFELESAMGRAASQDELIREVLRESAEACEATGGAVLLADAADERLELALWDRANPAGLEYKTWAFPRGGATVPPPGSRISSVLAESMQKAAPVRIAPSEGDEKATSVLAVPLKNEEGAPMGAMTLFGKMEGRAFADEDLELLRIIAANFCTAIQLFRARVKREREERLSTIGSLLSSVMHDIKGPMAVISGYVQTMAKTESEAERQQYATLMLKQFESVAAMQREVLEFARGEKRVLVRRVYLGKFFEELAEELKRGMTGSKVTLKLELLDRTTARFDQNKITRVMHNLVRNAVEAIGPRGGSITLRVSRRPAPSGPSGKKGDLVIEVSDTGPGIPKEIEGKIFQSFVTAGKKVGTGLGLAIVKKIVEEHAGTVNLHSTSSGTTFTLILPQDDAKT